MQNRFFFDTADVAYIQDVWSELRDEVPPEWVYGVTTNPNALSKINVKTLDGFEQTTRELCELVTSIREGRPNGLVFVQMPNSKMEVEEILAWAEYVSELGDGVTHVGLKIPHFTYALDLSWELSNLISLNVTGISDWGTIFKAFQYPVEFASIIPGRMQEKGIDANAHLDFIRTDHINSIAKVIAGSMRTIEGLQDSISRGTIPTIGARVWDQYLKNPELWITFTDMWDKSREVSQFIADYSYCPEVTQTNIQLSVDFFNQMDELGKPLYEEFING